ncbi:MAG: peptidoglycan editing factor PgeF [Clostridia bacterium]|nr:peptidoglycan editing factor PgeF [Clostridia bacterium]
MEISEFEKRVQRGFARHDEGEVVYLSVPTIDECGCFVHGFMTRHGGVSEGPYASLNLSLTREASPENKAENFRRAVTALGLDPASMVLVNYEHGDGIAAVSAEDAGKGFTKPTDLPKCDGLYVDGPDITAVTLHADCVPVFVVDRKGGRGAVCHAGWKGTVKRLPQKLVEKLFKEGSRLEDIVVGIGPHIRSCCFEVGEDVSGVFREEFGEETVVSMPGEKDHVSLERALLLQLQDAGLAPEQVTVAEECTFCRDDLFYSHRRDRGVTGAMGAFLALS